MKAVIERILSGENDAFEEIVEEYGPKLMAIAFRYFNDWQKAEEMAQQSFIKVYKHLDQYDTSRPFGPWIYRIHINLCHSHYRKQRLRKRLFTPLSSLNGQIPASSVPPSDEDTSVIMNCVEALPWKQRTAFILVEIEELSSIEAAETMDCSDSTVRVHLHRAKKNLRQRLTELGYHHE